MDSLAPALSKSPLKPSTNGAIKDSATDKQPHPLADPEEDVLRKIVMDYLAHNCYISTARAMSKPRRTASHDSSFPSTNVDHKGSTYNGNGTTALLSAMSSSSMEVDQELLLAGATAHQPSSSSSSSVLDGAGAVAELMDVDDDQVMHASEEDIVDEEITHKKVNGGVNGSSSNSVGVSSNGNGVTHLNGHSHCEKQEAEASLMSEEDFQQIEWRKAIKERILSGSIPSAMNLIRTHFPEVLASDGTSLDPTLGIEAPKPVPGKLARLSSSASNTIDPTLVTTATKPITTALKSAATSRFTPSASSTRTPPPTSTSSPSPLFPVPTSSMQPSHLTLNLLIQSFIETIRTIPLSPAPPSPTSSFHSESTSSGSLASEPISSALAQAQRLFSLANELPNPQDRAWYLRELEGVSALMAYKDPEASPVKTYLEERRRKSLANIVNSAILVNTGHPPLPLVDSLTRQTAVTWTQLKNTLPNAPIPWRADDGEEKHLLSSYMNNTETFALESFINLAPR